MTIMQAIILGFVQGITEFLPISSSAHLVITPFLLQWKIPEQQAFIFDVLVQVGTLIAVIIFFWRDLLQILQAVLTDLTRKKFLTTPQSLLGWYILLASLPAGILGILVKDKVESAFSNPRMTAIFLMITAIFLVLAERFGKRTRTIERMNWFDALWIGLFQALAIFPGISRSGATISGGMFKSFDRPSAARFSFLISIPIMLAAGLLAVADLIQTSNISNQIPTLLTGFIIAIIVGYLSIRWLLSYLSRRSLYNFAIYCLVVGLLTFLMTI